MTFASLGWEAISGLCYAPFLIASILCFFYFQPRKNTVQLKTNSFRKLSSILSIHNAHFDIHSILDRIIEVSLEVSSAVLVCLVYRDEEGIIVMTWNGQTKNKYENININGGIVELVLNTGKPSLLHHYNAKGFEKFIGLKSRNVVCVPIPGDDPLSIGAILFGMPNYDIPEDPILEDLTECISFNASLMLEKFKRDRMHRREAIMSSVFLALARSRSSDDSFQKVLDIIIESVYQLVEAEFVSIYVCDHHRRDLTLVASKDGFQGLTIDFGQGIAGHVASTAQSVMIRDCYSDSRFDQKMDMVAQHRTKSMLCVPILGFGSTTGKAIAVIQAMNKETKECFEKEDEINLIKLANEISKTFKSRIVEVRTISSPNQFEDDEFLEEGLYREYGSTISKRFRISDDLQMHRVEHLFAAVKKSESSRELPLTPKPHRSQSYFSDGLLINNWNVDPFGFDDDLLQRLLLHMLYEFEIDEILRVEKATTVAFLSAVRGKYRTNPFHNFKHAFGVTHISYMILKNGAANYLTKLEILGVLIAAYCHDLDHPGNTNAFEVATCSPLALLYSFESVLERHHSHICHFLINDPQCNILNQLNFAEKSEMRSILTHAILSTDMAKHADEMELLYKCAANNPPFDKTDKKSRYMLISFILHSADIGAQTQDISIAAKWGECCRSEFRAQVLKEVEMGVPPTAYMMGLESDLKYYQLQTGFVSGFVLPLWQVFASCIPDLEFAATQCESNVAFYKEQVQCLHLSDPPSPRSDI